MLVQDPIYDLLRPFKYYVSSKEGQCLAESAKLFFDIGKEGVTKIRTLLKYLS